MALSWGRRWQKHAVVRFFVTRNPGTRLSAITASIKRYRGFVVVSPIEGCLRSRHRSAWCFGSIALEWRRGAPGVDFLRWSGVRIDPSSGWRREWQEIERRKA